jgi:hypothetical protein
MEIAVKENLRPVKTHRQLGLHGDTSEGWVDEPKLLRRRYQELRYQVSIFSFMSRGKSKNLDPPNKINFFPPGP